MSVLTLTDTAEQVTIAIRVKDRDKMIDFYKDIIGFTLKREENTLAIMGVKEDETQYLWLEESPRAKEHFGEVKKLNQFTLEISNIEELGDVYHRFKQADYPIVATNYEKKVRVLVDDPEGNRLEIVASNDNQAVKNDEQLLALATGKFVALSPKISLQEVQLNVNEPKKEEEFLQSVLDFHLGKEESGKDSDFDVIVNQTDSTVAGIESSEVLGLEIIRFVVTEEVIAAIEKQFIEQQQDYYVDKKKTILTVYDPAGLEWWFVRKR